jgi:phage baseplate assembly protein W
MDIKSLDPAKAFLGVGWSFPVSPQPPSGEVSLAAYEDDIRQAILLILETDLGERVMRPDFGSGLRSLVFQPMNTATMALAEHQVEQALVTWEPRIQVQEVVVTADTSLQNRLLIRVSYRVRTTNTFYNLVYPFYLREGLS